MFRPIVNTSSNGRTLCAPTSSGLLISVLSVSTRVNPCTNVDELSLFPFPSSPFVFIPVDHTVPSFNNIVVFVVPAFMYFTLVVGAPSGRSSSVAVSVLLFSPVTMSGIVIFVNVVTFVFVPIPNSPFVFCPVPYMFPSVSFTIV